MARGRPHGRTKSDHRDCQAALYAAAEYRDRISISAEKQEALIAAVNAQRDAEPPARRKRGQKIKADVDGQRSFCQHAMPQGYSSAGRGAEAAKRRLSHALHGVKDPHALHCHDCGVTAEFGLRGGKDGGQLKYFCQVHGRRSGVFLVDKDRAAWVSARVQRLLEAELNWREEQLRQMRDGHRPFDAVWNGTYSSEVFYTPAPMSHQLLAFLLKIGGIESNPGPCISEAPTGYEPTSPKYTIVRTEEEMLASQAASDKRRRAGDLPDVFENFFLPGHPRQFENQPLEEGAAFLGNVNQTLTASPVGERGRLHGGEDVGAAVYSAGPSEWSALGNGGGYPKETETSHGLADPSHFQEFLRKRQEEKQLASSQQETPAAFDSQASGNDHSMTDAANESREDGSERAESEGEGENIEDSMNEKESSDEETSELREMIDDATQDPDIVNPVIQAGLFDAARRSASGSQSENLSQILKGGFKPRARGRATSGRRRAVESDSDESSAGESSAPQRHVASHGSEDQSCSASLEAPPAPEGEREGARLDDFNDVGDQPTVSREMCVAPAAVESDSEPRPHPSAEPTPSSPSASPPIPAAASPPRGVAEQSAAHMASVPPVASATAPASVASHLDPCLAAAHWFHSVGVATMTLELEAYRNEQGEEKKKPIGLRRDWETKCNVGYCLQNWVQPRRGCLAISTGFSDILAVDIDSKDKGCETSDAMLAEHAPLPADTPSEWTGHRPGRHFLFSLSQSKEAGLLNGGNRNGLHYEGRKVGIDTRGEGGLLFVGPTSYRGLDGTVRRYEWIQEIAPDRSNLRALPGWLIQIFNASDAHAATDSRPSHTADWVARRQFRTTTEDIDDDETVDVNGPLAPTLLKRIEDCVAATGDTCSCFDKLKRSLAGDMYVFRVRGERTCPYGAYHCGSNNFCVLVRRKEVLYHCNSSECCDVKPKCKIGELTLEESMLGGETAPFSENDATVYGRLTRRFVDNWAFQGDKGGSRIVAQMYADSHRLWHDKKHWWIWDGRRFEQTTASVVRIVISHQLSTVYRMLREELEEQLDNLSDDDLGEKQRLTSKLKQIRSYNYKCEVDATLGMMEGELVQSFVSKLDSNPDILNVENGVLNLRTGLLDIHRPGYMCSKLAGVAFRGLDHPTPTVDGFLADIFNDDRALIDYMQRLWGYSINGLTSEEIIVFLLGAGGNGKGVCKQMVESTLGDYYAVMTKDAVVKAPGQRPPSKGAATNYLAELQGHRVAVADETSPGERVDLGLVLMMTGGGAVSARNLFQNNVRFRFSHTPFIQTNYDPEIPPTLAKQPNVERRLIVIRFPNIYVTADKFDEANPRHRRVDVELKARMETSEVREEFLTFLVKGSCAWYEDRKVLQSRPAAVTVATNAWLRRGDKLQAFLESEHHCMVDPEGTPEGDKSIAWEEEFHKKFSDFTEMKVSKEELARQMKAKGYCRTKRGGRFDGEPPESRYSCYVGLTTTRG